MFMYNITEGQHDNLKLNEDTNIYARIHGDITSDKPITITIDASAKQIHGKIEAPLATVILKGGLFKTLQISNDVIAHKVIKKGKVIVYGEIKEV